MPALCDLHTHSHYSDGTCSPADILREAERTELRAVALTDHNTVAGLPEFLAAARGGTVTAIPGVEISTGYRSKELHILGLFLPMDRLEMITPVLDEILRRKEESNRCLIRALALAGCPIDYEALLQSHPAGNLNRSGIATALLEKGYVSSRDEAFRGLLHPKKGVYQPPERVCVFEIIEFLASMGAVSVLAHPFLKLSEQELRDFLPEAKRHGLAAMETLYSTFSPEQTTLAQEIAREFDLKESGGSDFHGSAKPDIQLGTGRGDLAVPAEFVHSLCPISSRKE